MHFLKLVVVPAGIFPVNVMIKAIKKLKNLENKYKRSEREGASFRLL